MSQLLVKVALDQTGIDAQLNQLSGKFKKAAKSIAAITVPIAAIAGIGKMISSMAAMGEQAAKSAGAIHDQAMQLGVTAEKLQEYRLVANAAGVTTEGFDKALGILNRTVGEAAIGQGTFEEILNSVGLQLRDSEGRVKSVSTVYAELSEKVRDGSLSQAQSVAVAAAAFGREGGKMVQVLRQTEDEQRRVIEAAREYGAILSNEVVAAADEYADKLELIQIGTAALDTQSKLILAPLAVKWAELKNEIAGTVAELARAAGLVDNNAMLMQRDLKQIEQRIANHRLYLEQTKNPLGEQDPILKQMLADWQSINDQIQAANKKAEEAAAVMAPGNSVDDTSEYAESDSDKQERQREAERAARDAAEAELRLATDVQEERDRIAALEVEQEAYWENVLAEQREEFAVAELEAEAALVDAVLLERVRLNADELDMMINHESELTRIHREGVEARKRFTDMSTQAQASTILGSLVSITAGTAQHSKKMFEINKKASLAQAAASLPTAIIKSFQNAGGYPWGIIPAALMAAAGAAQIQAIRKTTFEGGGGGTTPSAAGSAPVVNGTPAAQVLRVEGISSSSLFSGGAVRDLAKRLLEFQKDGGQVILQ